MDETSSASEPVIIDTDLGSLKLSPLRRFIKNVSAKSSALWPVTILLTPSYAAPLSNACLLKTPQKVQLFVNPITFTISSILHPYKSL